MSMLPERFRVLLACLAAFVLLVGVAAGKAQEETLGLDTLLESADASAQENLDPEFLKALHEGDREKVEQILQQVREELTNDYVLDVAAVKDAVTTVLPLLEEYEETFPYALWLRTRLDYFEVASDLDARIPAPSVKPGAAPQRKAKPGVAMQQEIWIKKVSKRPWPKAANEYVPKLKPIFAAAKVPPELVWIAEAESSFDPRARSPEGAVGLFQLMAPTAKRYGVRTFLPDERKNPEIAARAAAQYLAFLHGKFKDWRLALAAYNCGEGRVEKLLAGQKARSFAAVAARLPAETQLYVPKVEAILLRRENKRIEELTPASR